MDYFNDVLAMFWGLERVSCIAVYAGSKSLESLYFIKNILICVPKMNKGLTGLERHECQTLSSSAFVSSPLYGPSCSPSLVNSSPSVS